MKSEEVEAHIARLLSQIVDVTDWPTVRTQSFDSMGMDSISRVGLIVELEKHLQRTLDPDLTFVYQTAEELAGALSSLS